MIRERFPVWMSDIDGTAIELAAEKWSLQNALKSNLKPVPGFEDFVEGTRLIGVPFRGFISRRPDFFQRNAATMRSLSLFEDEKLRDSPYQHAGTLNPFHNHEGRKAAAIVQAALGHDAFGFIDDKPHRIGAELISAIDTIDRSKQSVRVVLGAVAQKGSTYFDELWETFDRASIENSGIEATHREKSGHMRIGNSALHIVTVDRFDIDTGVTFAEAVRNQALRAA